MSLSVTVVYRNTPSPFWKICWQKGNCSYKQFRFFHISVFKYLFFVQCRSRVYFINSNLEQRKKLTRSRVTSYEIVNTRSSNLSFPTIFSKYWLFSKKERSTWSTWYSLSGIWEKRKRNFGVKTVLKNHQFNFWCEITFSKTS